MPKVTRRPLAALDVFDIWDFIAAGSLAEADRWVDKLNEKFNLIAGQPLMGRPRGELSASLRSFPFGRYGSSLSHSKTASTSCGCSMARATIDAVLGEGE